MNGFVKSGLTLALTLCVCGKAYAHAHLLQSTPAADGVLAASPSTLSLDFSEGLEIGLCGVILKGQDGRVIPTGAAVLTPNDEKNITVPLNGVLRAGKYTVQWHSLSRDGHATHGSYEFTVLP